MAGSLPLKGPSALLVLALLVLGPVLASCEGSSSNKEEVILGRVKEFENEIPVLTEEDANLTLEQAVANVAGKDRTVIYVAVAGNYKDMLYNWYLSVEKFGHGSKVLFIAEDEEAFEYLRAKWPKQTVYPHKNEVIEGDAKTSTFESLYFNSLMDRKPGYIMSLLEQNLTVFFNDIDMVWLRDPFPYLQGDYDVLVQEDGSVFNDTFERFPDDKPALPMVDAGYIHQICGCLFFAHPTENAKRFVERWRNFTSGAAKWNGHPVNEQIELNNAIRQTSAQDLKIGVLPVQTFPSGCIYFGYPDQKEHLCTKEHNLFQEARDAGKIAPAIVHNNWITGYGPKFWRFKEHGLWFVPEEKNT